MSQSSLESGYHSNNEENIPEPNMARILADKFRLENDYVIEKLLMNSANGRIYTGIERGTGQRVVLKQIPRSNCTTWVKLDGHLVPSEISNHFHAAKFDRNEVIVRPITWMEKKSSFVLVMEYVENSCDLFELSKKYGALNEQAVLIIFRQMVQIMECLQAAGICHRDIKDENIIICLETLQIKLIDFGCSTKLTEAQVTDFSGTPEFYPPEFWRNRRYTHDGLTVWSVGIVVYILLTGSLPCSDVAEIAQFRIENDRFYSKSSRVTQKVLKSLLHNFPSRRISTGNISKLVDLWEADIC